MSFRIKLGLAFGAILVLTIIVAITSIYGMNRALNRQKELYLFTRSLENAFQTIAQEQQSYMVTGDIKHSMAILSLISQTQTNIDILHAGSRKKEQRVQIENVLSALVRYRESFELVVQNKVDMETMKSRMLHESQRLIANVGAIEKIGDATVNILKRINETLAAEKNFILKGKEEAARKVSENSKWIIGRANEIRAGHVASSMRLYAFRIANIATMYQSAFEKYVGFHKLQRDAVLDMTASFDRFEDALDMYIELMSGVEKKIIADLKHLVILISFIAILLGGFAILFLSKVIAVPINRLKVSALEIQSGHLDTRVEINSKDEIGELGEIFNQMAAQLEQNFRALDDYRNHLEELVKVRTQKIQEEIQQHQLTQNDLEKEKDRALKYFDIAGSILIVLNRDQIVSMINKAGCTVLGGNKEQIVGKNYFDTFVPENRRKEGKRVFDELVAEDRTPQPFFESRILTLHGEERIISWRNSVLRDNSDSGKILTFLSSGEDITHILQIEKDRQKLQKRLQQARKMEAIGTLAGGIAHDFNNILYPIIGYAEMAIDDLPENSLLRDDIKNILQGAIRAKELVRQILAFSRQKQLTKQTLLVQPIVKEALKLLRSIIPKNIDIHQDVSMDTGPVLGDPTQVYEIIMNLCTNAYHAMEDNGGILSVELNEEDIDGIHPEKVDLPQGRYCVLSVRDTGGGISNEIIDQIFDPYFTTKKIGKGSGLGLAVIQGIVKDYGGNIRVSSVLGEGTVFYIYLPVCPFKGSDVFEKASAKNIFGTEQILFVDDERAIVDLGIRMLTECGYQVSGKTSSLEALALFASTPTRFDLVITDMTMPGMMGTTLLKKIRNIRSDIPVMICTGFSQYIDSEKAKALDIQGFIRKPVLRDELCLTVREILDNKKVK